MSFVQNSENSHTYYYYKLRTADYIHKKINKYIYMHFLFEKGSQRAYYIVFLNFNSSTTHDYEIIFKGRIAQGSFLTVFLHSFIYCRRIEFFRHSDACLCVCVTREQKSYCFARNFIHTSIYMYKMQRMRARNRETVKTTTREGNEVKNTICP